MIPEIFSPLSQECEQVSPKPSKRLEAQAFLKAAQTTALFIKNELTIGKEKRIKLAETIHATLNQKAFQGSNLEEDTGLLNKKFLRFRPRLAGAVAAYALVTNESYEEIEQQGGLDAFYLFWALGSIQDDFIDTLPRDLSMVPQERRKQIGEALFGEERK